MYEKFGEFDSFEELNRAAAAQKAEGDEEALFALAQENGLDKEDVEDYLDGIVEELATVSMAALGKLKLEKEDLLSSVMVLPGWKLQVSGFPFPIMLFRSLVNPLYTDHVVERTVLT